MAPKSLSISFLCRKSKTDKLGYAPLECVVTLNGQRHSFTLPHREKPTYNKNKCAYVHLIYSRVLDYIDKYGAIDQNFKTYITVGTINSVPTINDLLSSFLKQNQNNLSPLTQKRFRLTTKLFISTCGNLIVNQYNRNHINIFVNKIKEKYSPDAARGQLNRLQRLFNYANDNNYTQQNLFSGIKLQRSPQKTDYLTINEIKKIQQLTTNSKALKYAIELSLCQMFLGLSFSDLWLFHHKKINDNYYIYGNRKKTNGHYAIPVPKEILPILKKYEWQLPKLSNQKYNQYLKLIGERIGKPNLTSHLFRHTYAQQLFNNGYDLNTIAKMLGHTNSTTTRSYYVTPTDIADDNFISSLLNKSK